MSERIKTCLNSKENDLQLKGFTKRVLFSPMVFNGSKYPCPQGKKRKNSYNDMWNYRF